MGRFLRVLTVFIFLLSIAALTLGIMLFNRRETLKGRTQKLETAIRMVVRTFEAEEPPEPDPVPTYPHRDESDVSAQPLDDPLRSDFWNRYNHELEEGSLNFMEFDAQSRLRQLMRYYRWDDVEDKAWRDPLNNQKSTTGPGTMQELLDRMQAQADAQLARLLKTRAELVKTRAELVTTITELNQRKATLRDRLAEIVRLNNEIQRLNGEIRRRDGQIAELQGTVNRLEIRIAELESEKLQLEEDNENLRIRNEAHMARIAELQGRIDQLEQRGGLVTETQDDRDGLVVYTMRLDIKAGTKGVVERVDEHHGFVVLRLNEEFLAELLAQIETADQVPSLRLNIQRGDGDEAQFVTKVRLTQLRVDERLGIGTILPSWQQMPVKAGDIIFF